MVRWMADMMICRGAAPEAFSSHSIVSEMVSNDQGFWGGGLFPIFQTKKYSVIRTSRGYGGSQLQNGAKPRSCLEGLPAALP